jgi:hypothetical protein
MQFNKLPPQKESIYKYLLAIYDLKFCILNIFKFSLMSNGYYSKVTCLAKPNTTNIERKYVNQLCNMTLCLHICLPHKGETYSILERQN